MARLLCFSLVSFAVGIVWLQQQAELPDFNKIILLSTLSALAFLSSSALNHFLGRGGQQLKRAFLLKFLFQLKLTFGFLLMLFLGITWATWCAQLRMQDRLSANIENKIHSIQGTIVGIPIAQVSETNARRGWRFLFEPDNCVQIHDAATTHLQSSNPIHLAENKQIKSEIIPCHAYPRRLLLNWYDDKNLKSGQRWQITVVLKRPHGLSNPAGSDYEAWLFQHGIGATGSVRHGSYLGDSDDLRYVIDHWRITLIQHIRSILSDQTAHLGIIQALAVGEQQAVTQKDWERFRTTGTSHLLAISGLHITLVAGFFAYLGAWCWRSSVRLILLVPASTIGLLFGLIGAGIYGLLSGLHIPAQRALIMLAVLVLSYSSGRLTSSFVTLSWALFAVLLFDPWAVLSPGFWLSFIAVTAILFALQGRGQNQSISAHMTSLAAATYWQKFKTKLRQASHIQLAVSVMLVPLTALFFGQISLVSPLANALAIPVFSFLIVPLVLLGMLFPAPLAHWFFSLAHQLIEWLAYYLDCLASWPYASLTIFSVPYWAWILSLFGACWFVYARRWRIVGLLLLCFLFWRDTSEIPDYGQFYATVFDVGQGGAIFIRTANHALLFDSGPAYFSGNDAATRVILPYLRLRGVSILDKLIVSHQDKDHSGGMQTLLKHLVVRELSSSIPKAHPILQNKEVNSVSHIPCQAGQTWEWDGVKFHVLHPLPGAQGKPNTLSCTLHIATAHHALLLPGDIESGQEQSILTRVLAEALRATVLLMPHHGSKTSSSVEWLEAVKPKIAIAQVGYLNRFRHPRSEILLRYTGREIKVLRSDYHGAIELQTNGEHIQWQSWREQKRRYWHWQGIYF